jgi:hypothetical protein
MTVYDKPAQARDTVISITSGDRKRRLPHHPHLPSRKYL